MEKDKTKSETFVSRGQIACTALGCLSILSGIFFICYWETLFDKILFSVSW